MRLSSWGDSAITVRVTLGATVVELVDAEYGSLDETAIARVDNALTRLADEPKPMRLIVDLSKVEFLGAKLIGVLVNTRHRLKKQHRRLVLCGLTPACAKLAGVLHLDRLFEIFPTQRMALRAAMPNTPHAINRRAAIRVRIAISDVAWDRDKVRLDYLTESNAPIYTRIISRRQTRGIYG